jgi:hypothetical protein
MDGELRGRMRIYEHFNDLIFGASVMTNFLGSF